MKTLQSHTAGLGETWSLLDNENNLTAICPRVNPDSGLQISSDEAERLLVHCVEHGNMNPDEGNNMWAHLVQQPEPEADGLDVYAWDTHGETEDDERSFGPVYGDDPPDEERDGTLADGPCPFPPLFEIADDVSQLAADLAEKLVRIDEMACSISGAADTAEDVRVREDLACSLVQLEYCEGAIVEAYKRIGADCLAQGGAA